MDRRQDRQRLGGIGPFGPGFPGRQGPGPGPERAGTPQLVAVVCCVCQRRRNVPPRVAREAGDKYVCMACREQGRKPPP